MSGRIREQQKSPGEVKRTYSLSLQPPVGGSTMPPSTLVALQPLLFPPCRNFMAVTVWPGTRACRESMSR